MECLSKESPTYRGGLGFRVEAAGFRVEDLGFRVEDLGFKGLRVQGLGFTHTEEKGDEELLLTTLLRLPITQEPASCSM